MTRHKCTPRKRHRITIERSTETINASGQVSKTWAPIHTRVAANVVPMSGAETVTGLQTEARVSHRVFLNYIAGITTADRIKFDDRTLEILSALDVNEDRREILAVCLEVV
jgi:SPP1 family predicted phage head-tail adaptor